MNTFDDEFSVEQYFPYDGPKRLTIDTHVAGRSHENADPGARLFENGL